MCRFQSRLRSLFNNRWLVFVGAMWVQACAGIGYVYGSLSPVIKHSLGYNQRQIATIGVAKDLGDSVGFLAGTLCEILPLWAALLIGSLQNFIGYGWVWLIVTGRTSPLPLWAVDNSLGCLLRIWHVGIRECLGFLWCCVAYFPFDFSDFINVEC